jgi:hypothetical protein
MDLRPQTLWEASLAVRTKDLMVLRLGIGPKPDSQGGKNAKFGSPVPDQCTRNVVGNDEGNKVTETIFTGSREFIMIAVAGEIISQSAEPFSVSGVGLNTYGVCPHIPTGCGHSYRKHCRANWRLAT